MITVHHMRIWDQASGEMTVSPNKWTAAMIATFGGEIVPDTDEQVEASELNEQGRYDRKTA